MLYYLCFNFNRKENEDCQANFVYCFMCFHYIALLRYPEGQPATEFDMDKVKTTVKQFVRDWSDDGKHERDACYKPVLDEIEELFPPDRWYVILTYHRTNFLKC